MTARLGNYLSDVQRAITRRPFDPPDNPGGAAVYPFQLVENNNDAVAIPELIIDYDQSADEPMEIVEADLIEDRIDDRMTRFDQKAAA